MDPFITTDDLLKFLQLPPHQLMDKFIEEHVNKKRGSKVFSTYNAKKYINPRKKNVKEFPLTYGTSRKDSSSRVYLWRGKLKKKIIKKIQKESKKPMNTLGYDSI